MASLALGTVQLGMGYGAANTTGRSHFMRACLRAERPRCSYDVFFGFFLVFEADSLCCSSLWDPPPVASRSGTTLRCVCVRDRDANRCKCISCPRNARDIPAGMWKVGTIVSTQIKVSLIIVVSEWLAEWLWHGMHRPRPPRSCTLPQRTGSRRLTRRTLTTCPRRASAMPLPSSPSPAVPTWSVFPPPSLMTCLTTLPGAGSGQPGHARARVWSVHPGQIPPAPSQELGLEMEMAEHYVLKVGIDRIFI